MSKLGDPLIPRSRIIECIEDHERLTDAMIRKIETDALGVPDFDFAPVLSATGDIMKHNKRLRALLRLCLERWTLNNDRPRRKCLNYALPPVEVET
jgi:hypothetical protein